MLYQELRDEVCRMNKELPKNGLVVWSGGNVSGIVRSEGHVVIKPSGVPFDQLTPESLVVVDLENNHIEGKYKASVDVEIHTYIYLHREDVGGVCHTHAPYCTSFSLLGQSIPMALTPIAHLLGHNVPCTGYVKPGHLDTAKAIIDVVGDRNAILVKRHGPFTFGKTPTDSVKLAAYLEEAAKTIHFAMLHGNVEGLPQEEIERSYKWFKEHYGQKHK